MGDEPMVTSSESADKAQENEENLDDDENEEEPLFTKQADSVLKEIWKFAQTYSIRAPGMETEQQMPVWYIMDEFGSRIQHSNVPNVRVVPFYFAGTQMFYSLMFPVAAIGEGDEVSRDYVEISEYRKEEWREFYLIPWTDADYSHLPVDNCPVPNEFFSNLIIRRIGGKLKVYADDNSLVKHLTPDDFELVQTEDEADVLWLRTHFKNFKKLANNLPNAMINQFPHESILTVKDLLAAAVQHSYRDSLEKSHDRLPYWFAMTYNLRTELPQFVSMFQNRAKKNLDNHWIVKPWNLARGLDTYVTSDLAQIIRLIDSGPKIACKYLSDPVCFYREDVDGWVKFDLRYIVLLKSVEPLEIYVYNGFWLRFALKAFTLTECDDYEKHFTVFNYMDESKILQMRCEDFIKKFEEQNLGISWKNVQNQMNDVIRNGP